MSGTDQIFFLKFFLFGRQLLYSTDQLSVNECFNDGGYD